MLTFHDVSQSPEDIEGEFKLDTGRIRFGTNFYPMSDQKEILAFISGKTDKVCLCVGSKITRNDDMIIFSTDDMEFEIKQEDCIQAFKDLAIFIDQTDVPPISHLVPKTIGARLKNDILSIEYEWDRQCTDSFKCDLKSLMTTSNDQDGRPMELELLAKMATSNLSCEPTLFQIRGDRLFVLRNYTMKNGKRQNGDERGFDLNVCREAFEQLCEAMK